MRLWVALTVAMLLAGCAGSPPEPARCEGGFRPINLEFQSSGPLDKTQSLALCLGTGARTNG
jgi:hypothetical protein